MTETALTLMTTAEMLARLKPGENELDLSIEKWERVAQWILAENRICRRDFGGDSCALCEVYLLSDDGLCKECPYFLYFGAFCDGYQQHWDAFAENRDYDTAIAMRDALKEIKENTNYEC